MEHRNASQHGSRGSVSLLPLIVLLAFIGCSNQSPYDEAVELIKQKKYDEAQEILRTITSDDTLASKAAVGILVCEMGKHYQKGDFKRAYEVLYRTGEKDGSRYYLVNISPTDSIFAHAAILAHLVAGEAVISEALEYNKSYEDDIESFGEASEILTSMVESVREGDSAPYRAFDFIEDGMQADAPPYLCSIGLPNLPSAEEWKSEVEELARRFAKLEEATSELRRHKEEAIRRREQAERDALVAEMTFSSKSDAAEWLSRGSGVWLQEQQIFAQKMGIYVKFYLVFSLNPTSGRGIITLGTASSQTLDDVERRSRMETWIISIHGNVVKFAVGSEWVTGEMTRTGENTAVHKSMGNMTRR